MTSRYGNIFHIADILLWESIDELWILITKGQ